MTTTSKPGSEAHAATFGGPGWVARTASHAEELAAGRLWRRCGVTCEADRLRAVLLAWPGDELAGDGPPDARLMLGPVDVAAIRRQTEAIGACFENNGVEVHLYTPPTPPPPNWIFMRDLFVATRDGIVIGRTAGVVRAGEERFAAHALATVGVPILHTVRGTAVLEGADVLWLDEHTVLVGLGLRTNAAGLGQIAGVVAEQGATAIAVVLPRGTQHLLGVVNFADRRLAVVRQDHAAPELLRLLSDHAIEVLAVPPNDEVIRGRATNFVTIEPRHVVIPARCPETRARFEAAGITCDEVDVSEYLKAAGGPGCLTGIVWRDSAAT